MKKHLLVTLAALGAAFAIAPAGLAANGDNSENAKLCQKSGWQSLYTPAGSPFADQGTCVSYGAQGGTLTTQPKTKSQLDCESLGGTFGADDQTGDVRSLLWSCNGNGVTADAAMFLLDDDCFFYDGGGGTTWVLVGTEGVSAYSCYSQ